MFSAGGNEKDAKNSRFVALKYKKTLIHSVQFKKDSSKLLEYYDGAYICDNKENTKVFGCTYLKYTGLVESGGIQLYTVVLPFTLVLEWVIAPFGFPEHCEQETSSLISTWIVTLHMHIDMIHL